MLRANKTTLFLVALSELADIDFHTARKILERRELDALSVVCKAADFDRALFLTFALLILDPNDNAMGKAKAYGELYAALPREPPCGPSASGACAVRRATWPPPDRGFPEAPDALLAPSRTPKVRL
jgi:hypothetical protein